MAEEEFELARLLIYDLSQLDPLSSVTPALCHALG